MDRRRSRSVFGTPLALHARGVSRQLAFRNLYGASFQSMVSSSSEAAKSGAILEQLNHVFDTKAFAYQRFPDRLPQYLWKPWWPDREYLNLFDSVWKVT